MQHLSSRELAEWLADANRPAPLLLDVREGWEFALGHLAEATHIPMALVPLRVNELPDERDIVCICHHGMRSYQVGMFLEKNGFERVWNLSGGVAGWSAEVDPTFPQY